MNVLFIGKHKYPKDVFSNEQDMKTWRSMAAHFNLLFVIAQSSDIVFHYAKENNIRVYLLPNIFGYSGFIIGAFALGFYIKIKCGIDVFDASEVVGGGVAAIFLKLATDVPVVAEIQGEIFGDVYENQGYKKTLLKKIGKFVMKKADRIRVNSNAVFHQVRRQGINENKIRLVHLRVDLNLFNPNLRVSDTRRNTRRKMTMGYIGRLIEGKGLEDLLAAIFRFRQNCSGQANFKLLVFGEGPMKDKLQKMAEKLQIDDKIEWRGFVSYIQVPRAFSEIDIFVYPSWHEGFGRSIMEALAMKKAVIATNVGGIPDLIKDGENGFLVEPRNPEELAKKIKILIDDPNLRNQFGEAGRKWVSENFEWDRGIKQFANLFLELAQSKSTNVS